MLTFRLDCGGTGYAVHFATEIKWPFAEMIPLKFSEMIPSNYFLQDSRAPPPAPLRKEAYCF